ncbi:MAG: GTPase ObgE [Syntrophobacterales bacterium]|jgi:GTP-binding protein|nr:GTPase ObgE [Syntrophobacterales bacterium]
MKFVDEALVHVEAGDGGRGSASFRREKYVPRGGPDGGNGGRGGDVVVTGKSYLTSLLDFRYKRIYRAENGKNGSGRNKKGRDGRDVYISVPLGTVVYDEKERSFLCDVTRDGESFIIAKGGRGGRGNASFATSVHRAPTRFEYGEEGEEKDLSLVLKLLADVGIVGLPNAGKSTLISRLTDAKPKIGDYPFTTLIPTLGVCRSDNDMFVIADIPGLVGGASQGKGLGITFLKHIERTGMILLVVDASSPDPESDYRILCHELSSYNEEIIGKKKILVLNKTDLVSHEETDKWEALFVSMGEEVIKVSALKGWGMEMLKDAIREKGTQRVI